MKYIDSEKLLAEIERRLKIVEPHKDTFESAAACRQELIWMKEFITSLQQEQPECIYGRTLEEREKYCKFCSAICEARIEQEPSEVDLEKEWKSYMESRKDDLSGSAVTVNMKDLARHFWNKGINARKEEFPEIGLDKFTEKIKTFQGRYKPPKSFSIKGAMAFMARMFYQYPNVARKWYDSLPKATMDNERKEE